MVFKSNMSYFHLKLLKIIKINFQWYQQCYGDKTLLNLCQMKDYFLE